MLALVKRHPLLTLTIGLAVTLCVLFIGSLFVPIVGYLCEYKDQASKPDCAYHHLGPFTVFWLFTVIEEHNAVVTALATLVMAVFTGTLWFVTKSSVDLGREEFIASRRAWLSIEDAKLEHPTAFGEGAIGFNVGVTIKNLGQTPAKGVWVSFDSYYPRNNAENFRSAEERFIARLRNHPAELGDILFPEDTLRRRERWADGIEKISAAIETPPGGDKRLGFVVFVGVVYWVSGDTTQHITYFPYSMLNVSVGFSVQDGQLIDLPRMPFVAGEAD